MLECTTLSFVDLSPEARMSLHECGEEEARRFKWIESEKAGRDLGELAIRAWIGQHWHGFLRQHGSIISRARPIGSSLIKGTLGSCERRFGPPP